MNLDFDTWAARNAALWQLYLDGELTAEAFINTLRTENNRWIAIFVEMGYKGASGSHEGTLESAIDSTEEFINGFLTGFLQDLRDGNVTDLRGAYRAFMYASEGSRMAYMLGQQQAMRERGARSWQRVLHPESSVTGPCDLCIQDSMRIHSVDEAFESLHPNEMCTMAQTVDYYPTEAGETKAESPFKVSMPVPNRFPTTPEQIALALNALGDKVKSYVRRVAPREVTTTAPDVLPGASPQEMVDEAIAPIMVMLEEERKKRGKRK